MRSRPLSLVLFFIGGLVAAGVYAQANLQAVTISNKSEVALSGYWLPVDHGRAARPAILALHGCGGLFGSNGKQLDARYPDYAQRLNRAGYHVLLLDSFTPRGLRSICAVKNSERSLRIETRRDDVLTALQWLRSRPEVDAKRIALLGWSNGASTLLSAVNAAREPHAVGLAAAVVFYPGCKATLNAAFKLDVPLLMLLGEKDDWTPPQPCIELVERTRKAQPQADLTLHVYPESYHGFDSTQPLRFRSDVPNGVNSKGVHQGGTPLARTQALQAMDAFFAKTLQ